MKKIFFIITLFSSALALASSASHDAGSELVPYGKIGWQAANLGILLFALIFFIRKSIVEAFKDRQLKYINEAEKTKAALTIAEASLLETKEKFSKLELGEKAALESAQIEAEKIKTNLIKEAEATAEKIKKEAINVINNEVSKAKILINQEILNQAMQATTKTLTSGAGAKNTSQEAAFLKQLEQVKA